jgi:Predicted membrane protein
MKKIRLIFTTIIAILLTIFALPKVPINAEISQQNLVIDVLLSQDGTATITEAWDVTVTEGTEIYFSIENIAGREIYDLKVSEATMGEFTQIDWNVNASFENKARKYGLVRTINGYEICWGISEYGVRHYTVQYKISNFVSSYNDYDGFNHEFIPASDWEPEHAKVTIRSDSHQFTAEDTRIWAFGHSGEIQLINGAIVTETDSAMSNYDYVTIMVSFSKGIFQPTRQENHSFKDVEDDAFIDSDYRDNNVSDYNWVPFYRTFHMVILSPALSMFFFFGLFLIIGKFMRRNVYKDNSYYQTQFGFSKKQAEEVYYREIPANDDIVMATWILKEVKAGITDGNIIGAFLLKWLQDGVIHFEEREARKWLVKIELQPTIIFDVPNLSAVTVAEDSLFKMLQAAAGSDGCLQEKEFERWIRRNYEVRVATWISRMKHEGETKAVQDNAAERMMRKALFGSMVSAGTKLNARGIEHAKNLLGLKHFLNDYSLISERHPNEVQLWKSYLIFASLFGIADRVAASFKKLYPDNFSQMYGQRSSMDFSTSMRMMRSFSRGYASSIAAAQRASGSSSSFSGGGGHSSSSGGGGSSGGGSRGVR